MALTAAVTIVSARRLMPKLWLVTLNLRLEDAGVEVFNKDFPERHRTGQSVTETIAKFLDPMQAAIDQYKTEQVLEGNASLVTAVDTLQTNLTT